MAKPTTAPEPTAEETAAAEAQAAATKAAEEKGGEKPADTPSPELSRISEIINKSELAGDEADPPVDEEKKDGEGDEPPPDSPLEKITDEQLLEAITSRPTLRQQVMATPETEQGINAIVEDLLGKRVEQEKQVAASKQATTNLREARAKGDDSGDYADYFALRDNLDRRSAIQKVVEGLAERKATETTHSTFEGALRATFPEEYAALTPQEIGALNVSNYANAEEALAVQMAYLTFKRTEGLGAERKVEVDESDKSTENERVAVKAATAQGGLPAGTPALAGTDDIGSLIRQGIGWEPDADDSD